MTTSIDPDRVTSGMLVEHVKTRRRATVHAVRRDGIDAVTWRYSVVPGQRMPARIETPIARFCEMFRLPSAERSR